jgi:signal transduction histidine kinase
LLPKRTHRGDEHSAFTNSERQLILAAETLRSNGDTAARPPKEEKGGEEKISLFWRVFGGTILSICALVVINAYQSQVNNIHELRLDIGRMREAGGEFIKKDEFNTRTTTMWNSIRDLQAVNATVTVLTNKLTAAEQQLATAERERKEMQAALAQAAVLEKQIKDAEAERKEICRELQQLRERLAKLEGKDELKPAVKPAAHQEPAPKN